MAVFSKFAVSVVAVAVGYEEEHCGTASALRVEQSITTQLNSSANSQTAGGQTVGQGTFSSEGNPYVFDQHGLREYFKQHGNNEPSQNPDHNDAHTVSSEMMKKISSKISLLEGEWTPQAVNGPQAVRKAFELLNRLDDKTLQEYCGAVKESTTTVDVVALFEDMPQTLQDAALNDITAYVEQQKSGSIMNAARMLQEELERSAPKNAAAVRAALKGSEVAYLCMLLVGCLIVCAGGCCLWAHWLCTRMGYAE